MIEVEKCSCCISVAVEHIMKGNLRDNMRKTVRNYCIHGKFELVFIEAKVGEGSGEGGLDIYNNIDKD